MAGGASGVAAAIGHLSARTRLLQSGLTRSYALYMLLGAALIIAAMLGGGPRSLVLIGVLTSAIAASFYVRVIVVMFFRDTDSGTDSGTDTGGGAEVAFARQPVTYAVVAIAVVVTLALGIAPQPLLDLAESASAFAR